MVRPSQTVDGMVAGQKYLVFVEVLMGTYSKVISCGSFVDEFEGLFLKDRKLYANFRQQGCIDCRTITRIEVR